MQPERWTEQQFDVRSDVWALGVALLEIASLHHPYQHCKDLFELMGTITQRLLPCAHVARV